MFHRVAPKARRTPASSLRWRMYISSVPNTPNARLVAKKAAISILRPMRRPLLRPILKLFCSRTVSILRICEYSNVQSSECAGARAHISP